ncbi:MAG: tail sheath stabilizer and completion protein, partial [Minisyncoccia bacterium]
MAAFDDTVIKRYDKNRLPKETIEVRYVLAPKQRVMYDIVNKAQNLTLPVVAVDVTSISRANDRVFNKLDNFYTPYTKNISTNIKMPIPVDIRVNMSILARYMQDIDQILSNFIPYNNPYIILSWKEPTEIPDQVVEIRSEVLWDGNISFNSPTDTTYNDKFRIVCDTSFTIKGWIFKNKRDLSTPIYFIDVNTYALNRTNIITYDSLSGLDIISDSFTLSGTPTITNIFYSTTGSRIPVTQDTILSKQLPFTNSFILYASNFTYTDTVLISTNNLSSTDNYPLTTINSTYTGGVTGLMLPTSSYEVLTDGVMSINLP